MKNGDDKGMSQGEKDQRRVINTLMLRIADQEEEARQWERKAKDYESLADLLKRKLRAAEKERAATEGELAMALSELERVDVELQAVRKRRRPRNE
jgi:hypothetical protein